MEKQSITNTLSSSWVRGTCVGRGCFGAVSTAISKTDGEVFAVKSVDLATCLPAQLDSLENEISVLRSLDPHPHIVRFLGDGVSKEGTTSFRNIHLEYLPEGDVAKNVIDETLLRRYTACLVSALRHVHSRGYVHCDVKARNVLVVSRSCSGVKLADFGSAIRVSKPKATGKITPRGSPLWMAPEVIRGEYQGPESDVWSLGCTVVEMLTGKPAWEDLGVDSLSRIGFSDELPVVPVMKLSETGRDFLDKCLKRDVSQRWSCDQLLKHPFLSQSQSHDLSYTESSPRYVLDWVNSDEEEEEVERSEWSSTAMARICKLATTRGANWETDGWVEVRSHHPSEEERAMIEYSEHNNTSLNPYDDVADESARSDVTVYPNRPPGNGDSAAEVQYEVEMMVLLLLMECMVYSRITCVFTEATLVTCCYQYHNKEMLSFNASLSFLFVCLLVCTCDSMDRTKLSLMKVIECPETRLL